LFVQLDKRGMAVKFQIILIIGQNGRMSYFSQNSSIYDGSDMLERHLMCSGDTTMLPIQFNIN